MAAGAKINDQGKPRTLRKRLGEAFKDTTRNASSAMRRRRRSSSPAAVVLTDIVSTLAQEIVEEIMENLANDCASLKNCSLVCHSWGVACTRVLFATFVVRPTPNGAYPNPLNPSFLHFFTASPHLAKNIRHLILSSSPRVYINAPFDLAALQQILARTPALQKLYIQVPRSSTSICRSPAHSPVDAPQHSLRHLQVASWSITQLDPSYIGRMLSLFNAVDELVVSASVAYRPDVIRFQIPPNTSVPFPFPPRRYPLRLARLVVEEGTNYQCVGGVLGLFLSITDPGCITSFSFRLPLCIVPLVDVIQDFVSRCRGIRDLTMKLDGGEFAHEIYHRSLPRYFGEVVPEYEDAPDFSFCTHISSLTIALQIYELHLDGTMNLSYSQWQITISQLRRSPPSLERITLLVAVSWSDIPGYDGMGTIASLPWSELDAILPQFQRLQCVYIKVHQAIRKPLTPSEQLVDIEDLVRDKFSAEYASLIRVELNT